MTMDRGIKGGRSAAPPSGEPEGVFVSLGLPDGIAGVFAGALPITSLRMEDLSRDRLEGLNIAVIACPLMAEGHDAMMVVQALKRAGYRGVLTVIAPRLPNAGMVEAELRGLCPDIRVKVISP